MNGSEMVSAVAAEAGVSEADARKVIDTFFTVACRNLMAGQTLSFRNFGKLEPRNRAPARRTNPKTGKVIDIPSRRSVFFAPAPLLKARLNGRAPAP